MSTTMSLKSSVGSILSGKMTMGELNALAENGNAFERVSAIKQIAKQFSSAESVVLLEAAARDPKNGIVLLGRTIKVIAIGSLLSMKREDATDAARRIIRTLSTNEAQDLAFHLQSEAIQMP